MPKAQLAEETQDMGVLDLMDPEIEYDPGEDSVEATVEDQDRSPPVRDLVPKLTLIVNDSPSRGTYEDHSSDGVDLTVYNRDPEMSATLSETMDAPMDLLDEAKTQDLSMPVLPQPRERLPIQAHRDAIAGRPVDALQAYFIANMDARECAEAPELAAVVLQARHDLHLLKPEEQDPSSVEDFREQCLLGLLRSAPLGDTPNLRMDWRSALKSLGELYD